MSTAGASAAANDAKVAADGPPGPDVLASLEAAVAGAQVKVSKQQAHLAGAKQALANAKAELAAAKRER